MLPRLRVVLPLVLSLSLASRVDATWSIVLVDKATGEVAVAGATCLEALNLLETLPVVLVGVGGGCAQSAIDTGAVNRQEMWDLLLAGTEPATIIAELKSGDILKCSRQYGLAVLYDADDAGAGFTGGCAGAAKKSVHGTVGDLTYSVQGNVLTGQAVVEMAVEAAVATPGRLSDKLMAAMQAAYLMGGDGRCSCDVDDPTSCGSPPPSFEKSAHIGFMVTARIGDADGVCNGAFGCANGDYWLKLNVIGVAADEDPVQQLQAQYDAFLAGLSGRPDGLLSVAAFDDAQVVGDGSSLRELHVGLVDVDGVPLDHGVGSVTVEHAPGSAGLSSLDSIVDHGDGTYTIRVQAGTGEGTDLFAVTFADDTTHATLFPYPALEHRAPLLATGEVSASAGGAITFDLLAPSAFANRPFVLGLSATGALDPAPGGGVLPLVPDRLSLLVPRLVLAGILGGVPGTLDAGGRAQAQLLAPAGFLSPLAGLELWAAYGTIRPADYASNAVAIPVLP